MPISHLIDLNKNWILCPHFLWVLLSSWNTLTILKANSCFQTDTSRILCGSANLRYPLEVFCSHTVWLLVKHFIAWARMSHSKTWQHFLQLCTFVLGAGEWGTLGVCSVQVQQAFGACVQGECLKLQKWCCYGGLYLQSRRAWNLNDFDLRQVVNFHPPLLHIFF